MNRPTLTEIAKHAGVSIATVSRVLNDKDGVRESTRRRVLGAIKELRFESDFAFPQLPDRMPAIAFLIPAAMKDTPLTAHTYLTQLQAIQVIADLQGVGVFVGGFSGGVGPAAMGDVLIRERRIIGAILARTRTEDEAYAQFREARIPFVVLNRLQSPKGVHAVGIDDRQAGFVACRHLIRLGHRKIAFIGGLPHVPVVSSRCDGYRQALEETGLPYREEYVVPTEWTERAVLAGVQRLLSLDDAPTGLVALNDHIAQRILDYCRSHHIAVPEQLAIVGFDNTDVGSYLVPALTSIDVPWGTIARVSTEMLFAAIKYPAIGEMRVELHAPLVVRASCGTGAQQRTDAS